MNPVLSKGDVLIWTAIEFEEICVGDIVVFNSYIKWPDEKLIAHRVTDIRTDKSSGELLFVTKGDSNECEDQKNKYLKMPYIQENNIRGKVVCIGDQPIKININLLIILIMISTILLTFLYQYKPLKRTRPNFFI